MKLKRENKGFSLVELIITIAIFSIVGVVVGAFLVSSSRAYSVNANELDIQEEAQLVANQLQEMILDTPLSISYKYAGVDASGNLLNGYLVDDAEIQAGATVSQKEVFIYAEDYYYRIYWNMDEQKLYFVEYKKGPTGFAPNDMDETGVVLGEYVSDFIVDLSQVGTDRLVSFHIIFKKPNSDRDYLVSKTVSLRNNILANRDITEVYDSIGVSVAPAADGMSLSPTTETVWPGESVPFTVTLNCSQGGVPNQGVNWSLESKDSEIPALDGGTFITSGNMLKVSTAEDSSWIQLTASAQGYDYSTNTDVPLTKNANVYVKQIKSLNIVSNTMDTGIVGAGGRYSIVVSMQGKHIDGMALDGDNGIEAIVTEGAGYVTSITVEPQGELQAKVTFDIAQSTPEGAKIQLTFKPKRMEFSDVYVTTDVYTVNGNKEMLMLESGSGTDWLRLGTSTANVKFVDEDIKNTYCNSNGTLKAGFYMKYVYEVYDSSQVLVKTAYRTTGAGTGSDYTDYFATSGAGSTFSSVVKMTDKIFMTSGTVKVKAYLMSQTQGSPVEVGSSNECTFIVPEVTIGFKRNKEDQAVSNMISYITRSNNNTPIYMTFTSGFAAGTTPSIERSLMNLTPTTYGSISGVDAANAKATITGVTTKSYYKTVLDKKMDFTYADLPNGVVIYLVSSNVSGTNYYVPLNKSEWTLYSTNNATGSSLKEYYRYYIDDTHYMYIYYKGGNFKKAELYALENQAWVSKREYKINTSNNKWDRR